jgi:hypothetical protein
MLRTLVELCDLRVSDVQEAKCSISDNVNVHVRQQLDIKVHTGNSEQVCETSFSHHCSLGEEKGVE